MTTVPTSTAPPAPPVQVVIAPPKTGLGSTSFFVHAAAYLTGIAAALTALLQNGSAVHTAVFGGGGALLATVSTVVKLLHDRGLHVATIQAAGSEVAKVLPQLREDIAGITGFIEHEWPGAKATFLAVGDRVQALEGKVASIPGTEAVLAALRDHLAPASAPATAPTSGPGGTVPA